MITHTLVPQQLRYRLHTLYKNTKRKSNICILLILSLINSYF